jgi:hypothetical protein
MSFADRRKAGAPIIVVGVVVLLEPPLHSILWPYLDRLLRKNHFPL